MGVNLSEMFYNNRYHAGVQTNTAEGISDADSESAYGENAGTTVLQPGQQFRGTVIAVDGEDVTIRMQDEQVFHARLENGLHLNRGMSLSFEVKGVQGGQIALTPLYSNLDQASSVYKALQMAELPVSEQSVRMVNEMMTQGMSIDKQSLQSMFHLAGQFEKTDASTIVQMKQLNLPILAENIEQFENYRNRTAQILDGYREIGTQVTELMKELANQGDTEELGKLFIQIMRAVSEEGILRKQPEETTDAGKHADTVESPAFADAVQTDPKLSSEVTVSDEKTFAKEHPELIEKLHTEVPEDELRQIRTEDRATQEPEKTTVSGNADTDAAGKALEALDEALRRNEEKEPYIHLEESEEPAVAFKKPQETIESQIVTEEQFQKFTDRLIRAEGQNGADQAAFYKEAGQVVARWMKLPEFETLVQDTLVKGWLLKPQEVQEKSNVQKLYQKVLEQTDRLKEILTDVGKDDSAVMKSVRNLSSNVEFLNQLNQNFSLVQLPLKMSEQKAHGDLYVYTNKRNLASGDGAVTALLHLAMDHLGAMDIYVAMQNRRVSTKFYLESDEMISFLEEHMKELDSRLAQKGYSMHSELLPKDHSDTQNVFDELLADSKKKGCAPLVMMSRQSFDARA